MKNAVGVCCLLVAVTVAVAAALAGCEPEPACVDGAQAACACPGGFQGVQVCESSRFGPCDCPDDAADAATSSDADSVDTRMNADTRTSTDTRTSADVLGVDIALVDAGSSDRAACITLGSFCDDGDVCCAGACDGTRCCMDLGGQCGYDTECCDSSYNFCNASGVCEARTCQEGNEGDYCDYVDLPCCDNRLTCRTTPDSPGYARCCAAVGTVMPASDGRLCCNSTLQNNDGSITCYDGQ